MVFIVFNRQLSHHMQIYRFFPAIGWHPQAQLGDGFSQTIPKACGFEAATLFLLVHRLACDAILRTLLDFIPYLVQQVYRFNRCEVVDIRQGQFL